MFESQLADPRAMFASNSCGQVWSGVEASSLGAGTNETDTFGSTTACSNVRIMRHDLATCIHLKIELQGKAQCSDSRYQSQE